MKFYGCRFAATAAITNNSGPAAIASPPTAASFVQSHGSMTLRAVNAATLRSTYSVDASPFTNNTTYNNLAAGSHDIIVKDVNGCSFSTTATITNNAGPTASASTPTAASCGQSNGALTLGAVTGGNSP